MKDFSSLRAIDGILYKAVPGFGCTDCAFEEIHFNGHSFCSKPMPDENGQYILYFWVYMGCLWACS